MPGARAVQRGWPRVAGRPRAVGRDYAPRPQTGQGDAQAPVAAMDPEAVPDTGGAAPMMLGGETVLWISAGPGPYPPE